MSAVSATDAGTSERTRTNNPPTVAKGDGMEVTHTYSKGKVVPADRRLRRIWVARGIFVSHHWRKEEQDSRHRVAGEAEHVDGKVVEREARHRLASAVDDELRVERDAPAEEIRPSKQARDCVGQSRPPIRHAGSDVEGQWRGCKWGAAAGWARGGGGRGEGSGARGRVKSEGGERLEEMLGERALLGGSPDLA